MRASGILGPFSLTIDGRNWAKGPPLCDDIGRPILLSLNVSVDYTSKWMPWEASELNSILGVAPSHNRTVNRPSVGQLLCRFFIRGEQPSRNRTLLVFLDRLSLMHPKHF